jgi:hypothetical protein
VPAPRVKQRKKDVGALSFPNPQNMQAGRKETSKARTARSYVVFWKVSQCVPPRDAFTREITKENPVSMLACKNQITERKKENRAPSMPEKL